VPVRQVVIVLVQHLKLLNSLEFSLLFSWLAPPVQQAVFVLAQQLVSVQVQLVSPHHRSRSRAHRRHQCHSQTVVV
jgi:hypothetical protein